MSGNEETEVQKQVNASLTSMDATTVQPQQLSACQSRVLSVRRTAHDASLHRRGRWIVLKDPITVSSEDLAQYHERIHFNARPVQRSLARFVLRWRRDVSKR